MVARIVRKYIPISMFFQGAKGISNIRSGMARRLRFFNRYATPGKIINFFKVHKNLTLKRNLIDSFPCFAIIGVNNICNLKCPICITGARRIGSNLGQMKFSLYKKLIDQVGKYLFRVTLNNFGEPFLNPDIYKMINYAKENNVGTLLSTSFTTCDEVDIQRIIESGLDEIWISIDGTTEETYLRYQVGGDFAKAMENMRLLVTRRNELNAKSPRVMWQFVVNKFNYHQIDDAREMAREIGLDEINFQPFNINQGVVEISADDSKLLLAEWTQEDERYRKDSTFLKKFGCDWLWTTIGIENDGRVVPCCLIYDFVGFGNILENTVSEIWNNEAYLSSRSLFTGKSARFVPTICANCTWYAKSSSKN